MVKVGIITGSTSSFEKRKRINKFDTQGMGSPSFLFYCLKSANFSHTVKKARFRELGVSEEAKKASVAVAVGAARYLYGHSAYSFCSFFLSIHLPLGTTPNGSGAGYEDLQQG
ncbi:hypothetical protein [Oceanobacillus indicireducens]|uniref:Uncharacterized protein n=1 Tax=Oceanobacillus indicireducens TaxID=1004261 RepID=A0A917XRA5_9BACI|nr:hypothetical protein [Oceanobacillus indicireducens]GGN50354.1 hypothetical protein GCM10007971_03790 [Oceanobacillus indicireducens]